MDIKGARVLVVEDEGMISFLIESFLAMLGCEVAGIAARLEDALDKAGRLELDLAMLDVNLAGRTSYPVAEILRERGVPFVFCTGYGSAGLPDDLRGVPVLGKPFQIAQLGAILEQAYTGRSRAQAAAPMQA